MFMKVRKKWFSWLVGLALSPMVGWGQPRIITHPQNVTVCMGEDAVFTGRAIVSNTAQTLHWRFNGTPHSFLPTEKRDLIEIPLATAEGVDKQNMVILNYNETFNGITVQFLVPIDPAIFSHLAYLFYEPSQQFSVANLMVTINTSTARLAWDSHDPNVTTQYLFGVYDSDNNLIANQTSGTTYVSYDLPPKVNDTCQYLAFRVTADQCPDPDNGFIQTEATTFVYTRPNVSPVTAQPDKAMVLVSWPSDGGSAFQIVVTDLESGEQFQTTRKTPPYAYTEKVCGKLNIAVSPAQCADDPAFTHSTNISIDCPTSGTQASYPSLLLAVAAIVPLLKWQH